MSAEQPKIEELKASIFNIASDKAFTEVALKVFQYQYAENQVYRSYCNQLGVFPQVIDQLDKIPFLPISFFKTHKVVANIGAESLIFTSSGTTGVQTSRHFVHDLTIYENSFMRTFQLFYGDIRKWCIVALLPSYLERSNSSLVYMAKSLMEKSGHRLNAFYLYDFENLHQRLTQLESKEQPTLLIGVTYALLDFAQQFPIPLKTTVVMETGGMKGRKKELVRHEVHAILKEGFQVDQIHSEYGMTELMSQAYAKKEGVFQTPPWMKMGIREEDNPLNCRFEVQYTTSGALNIIDLANLYSCSFIATEDVGRLYENGSFEVLGRLDNSDIRGCSLLAI